MRLTFLLVILAISGCSEEGEPGACYRASENACTEYGRSQGAAGKRMCSGKKWIPGTKACPMEGRLGTCIKAGSNTSDIIYSGPPNNFTVGSAKNSCDWAGGVFLQDFDAGSKR